MKKIIRLPPYITWSFKNDINHWCRFTNTV